MASGDVERLRAEVQKAVKSADRKVARLRSEKGVRIGLEPRFDPRRDKGVEGRYNAKQLRSYLADLRKFNSRSTQFVAGAEGVPIRAHVARQFQDTQERFNKTRAYLGRNIENVTIPGSEFTFGEENALLSKQGMSDRSPLARAAYNLRRMEGEKAVRTASRTMERRMSPQGQRKDIRRARETLDRMASYQGDGGEIRNRIASMSDSQVLAFWSSPAAVESLQFNMDSDKGYEDWTNDEATEQDMQENSEVWQRMEAIARVIR